MKRKILGKIIHPIGFGAFPLSDYLPLPSEEKAISVLKAAVELGAGIIDTADVYGPYTSEKLINKALVDKSIVATKAGCTRPGGDWGVDGSYEHILKSIEGSLERLGIKKIWLYQHHAPDLKVPLHESLKAFKDLQESGLFEHFGVSNYSLEQVKFAEKIISVSAVQNHFNLQCRHDERDLLPYLEKNDIPYLPYFPLGGGDVGGGGVLDNQIVKDIAIDNKCTVSQVALAWMLQNWNNIIPIPGTRNIDHLKENMKIIKLDEKDMELLNTKTPPRC